MHVRCARLPRLLAALATCALAQGAAAQNAAPVVQATSPVSFTLTQGATSTQIQAVERAEDAAAFYDYFSASSHTGFEAPFESKVFLYRDTTTGTLSLFFTHNVDRDTSGMPTGPGAVTLDLSGLPPGAFVAQSDDPSIGPRAELDLGFEPEGFWRYSDNTDGGVIGGLPTTSPWCVTITPLLFDNVSSWVYHYASGEAIPLSQALPVTICHEPAAGADTLEIDEGVVASLSGSFDDPDALDVHVATWSFGDGATAPVTYFPGPGSTHHDCDPAFHAYGDDATYAAVLTVMDQANASGQAEVEVVVANVAPAVALGSTLVTGVGIGLTIPAQATDPGSDDLSFTWDFGDGSPTVTNDHFNDGAAPDPDASGPGTFPFTVVDTVRHVWCEPGTHALVVTVTDDDGGSSTATASVQVLAFPSGSECNEPPACSAGPDVLVACGGAALAATASDPDGDPLTFAWTSSCPGTTFTPGPDALAPTITLPPSCDAACTLTLTVTDVVGAACSDEVVVTVRDLDPPVVTSCPPETSAACGDPALAALHQAWLDAFAATDACAAVTLSSTAAVEPTCGGASVETRTFTATDACGNAVSCTSTFTIVDAAPPVLAGVPADVVVSCDAVPPPAAVAASDACGPVDAPGFAEERTDGACGDAYTLTRTWTAVDACGNAVTATQVVGVVDLTPPTLSGVPADATVACDAVPPPATPAAIDSCDPSPSVTFAEAEAPGGCPAERVLTRTWTATDRCGNAASAVQVLTVVDDVGPIVEPSSAVVACLWSPNHAFVVLERSAFAPAITDACAGDVTWRFAGCASDQPDDGLGDGHTAGDCVVADGGERLLVRAERQGGVRGGRRYGVAVVATDACGNESAATVVGLVEVPHDAREHRECLRSTVR